MAILLKVLSFAIWIIIMLALILAARYETESNCQIPNRYSKFGNNADTNIRKLIKQMKGNR